MSQLGTSTKATDVTDRPTRGLGTVAVSHTNQDEFLPLILNELRRISVLLASMSMQEIDLREVLDV